MLTNAVRHTEKYQTLQLFRIEDITMSLDDRVDQVTQQNAALVEEAAAASESMHDQSQQLFRAVSEFKLNSEPILTPATPIAPRRAVPTVPTARSTTSTGRAVAAPITRSQQAVAPVASGGEWEKF